MKSSLTSSVDTACPDLDPSRPFAGFACGDIEVHKEEGMTILRQRGTRPHRRVFYLNSYGMAKAWSLYKDGLYPGQHLWGCLELTRYGYEIATPEESPTPFSDYHRQDFRHIGFIKHWLGRDGIVYAGHTILFWTPLLASLALLRSPVVGMFYARETLRFARGYRGMLALTPDAAEQARVCAPSARTLHISWGVELPFYPKLEYRPDWFLSCGKTRRDFATFAAAAAATSSPIRVINTELPTALFWPPNVHKFTGGSNGDWQTVSYHDLFHTHYAGCAASLVLMEADPQCGHAAGFTQLLEAMALGRPVIATRTGAVPSEIDVEQQGCGIFVPPNDPAAVADAMKTILSNPERAKAMGRSGRRLCESYYNMERFTSDLHRFFETL